MATARKKVSLREQEIGRLSTLVEMGRDVKTQAMLDAHDANVRAITQMQGQVDMLNEQLAAREQELEKLRSVEVRLFSSKGCCDEPTHLCARWTLDTLVISLSMVDY